MHAVFMLYGLKSKVDHLMMDMSAQKFQLKLTQEGEEDKFICIQGHIRILPFGNESIIGRCSVETIDFIPAALATGATRLYRESKGPGRFR